MIQLLRAHGFDRAKQGTVDLFTDLYVRYLELMIQEIRKLALDRGDLDEEIALQDITQGMLNIGIFKPMNLLDVYDENPFIQGDEGMQNFKRWLLKDPATADARVISTPSPELLKVGDKSSKPLSMIPEYINQLNVSDKKTGDRENETELVEAMINNGDMDDWIQFMLTSQKLDLAKRKSGKLPQDLSSLPSIPGLKYSKLSQSRMSVPNSCIPVGFEINEDDEEEKHDIQDSVEHQVLEKLISKLPIGNPRNRLENISVSYEDDTLETEEPLNIEEDQQELTDIDKGEYDFNAPGSGALTLGNLGTTKLDEMEDMENTFERRTSLDYGHTYDI
ncbi:unnamed protein product [Kluyveromyces dobzhanskii CBS 2104]|uniref:WGS project CCBQ000000000 data, contig 00058 n=1 Tax=Kluyveromyces dobzhanskii CBS 2104 TaxID=1427455 RepID=A0A0A8LCB6_9SACH|nr:unnamed protein product [Kluyveromyces dobzhanskii CBS 2104]